MKKIFFDTEFTGCIRTHPSLALGVYLKKGIPFMRL